MTSSLESILSTKTMIQGCPVFERSWKRARLVKVESADIEEQTVKDVDNEDEVVKEAKEVIASSIFMDEYDSTCIREVYAR